ncbi:MAG TPA: hypothetical protein DCL54_18875 [Alphaproteobacteria bacterium]|nr:hypothetical protein [Alphaproteobacteria bacterium]
MLRAIIGAFSGRPQNAAITTTRRYERTKGSSFAEEALSAPEELSQKIQALLPGLTSEETCRLRQAALELLDAMARDVCPRVRAILAEEIKACPHIPRHLALTLARDMETQVAAPILEYSPLLNEFDLLEIIAGAHAQGALQAIARRRKLSPAVSHAIAETVDVPAVAALLSNPDAMIRAETLDLLVASARHHLAWHAPLVAHPDLSLRAILRVANFVSAQLLAQLGQRPGLDEATALILRQRLQERLKQEGVFTAETADHAAIIQKALAKGVLDEDFVMEAVERGDRDLVMYALAALIKMPVGTVDKMLGSRSGKVMMALAWRAGLSARLGLKLQLLVANLPAQQRLLPRNGSDFPLSADEMRWHLDYFQAPS